MIDLSLMCCIWVHRPCVVIFMQMRISKISLDITSEVINRYYFSNSIYQILVKVMPYMDWAMEYAKIDTSAKKLFNA